MTVPRDIFFTLSLFLLPLFGGAETLAPSDLPQAKVYEVKRIDGGGFLFAIRLYAPSSKPLILFHPLKKREVGGSTSGEEDPSPFSLFGSTLQDLFTEKIYPCLPLLPDKPYVGPMDVTGALNSGGWMQFGVAFPFIPAPPEKDGKKQPYQLLFVVPELNIETKFTLDPETLKPIPSGSTRTP